MVYGFVKQSGGNIQLYSEPGDGTSVRIFCLRRKSRMVPRRRRRTIRGRRRCPQGEETILVVEDDARVRRVAVARLRGLGYRVIEAGDAAAALAALSHHPEIAMIFTDVVMPGGMSGDELAEAALARRPDVKILFTSAMRNRRSPDAA